MKRRDLLVAGATGVAIAVAGCSSDGDPEPEDDDDDDEEPAEPQVQGDDDDEPWESEVEGGDDGDDEPIDAALVDGYLNDAQASFVAALDATAGQDDGLDAALAASHTTPTRNPPRDALDETRSHLAEIDVDTMDIRDDQAETAADLEVAVALFDAVLDAQPTLGDAYPRVRDMRDALWDGDFEEVEDLESSARSRVDDAAGAVDELEGVFDDHDADVGELVDAISAGFFDDVLGDYHDEVETMDAIVTAVPRLPNAAVEFARGYRTLEASHGNHGQWAFELAEEKYEIAEGTGRSTSTSFPSVMRDVNAFAEPMADAAGRFRWAAREYEDGLYDEGDEYREVGEAHLDDARGTDLFGVFESSLFD